METRIEQARRHIITDEIRNAAKKENISEASLVAGLANGTIVLAKNRLRSIEPCAIGQGTRVKINANIGTSTAQYDLEIELEKMRVAVKAGADAIMDLSTGGPILEIRKKIIADCPVAVGTVPIYQAVADNEATGKDPHEMKASDFLRVVEMHCKEGVDFLTIHSGINRASAQAFAESNRLTGVVSRGGALIMEWMSKNGKENPYYENFDNVLAILHDYDATISLGDGLRPGSLHDATDRAQIEELAILGQLVERCRAAGVQCMVEGPGHVPLHQVETNIRLQKALCNGAPFYVLGPLVTDVTPGYDHISGAIGGALAAMAGADFLCYLTPAEHLRLPSVEDVKEGVIASKIAAHAADIARGQEGAIEWDHRISAAKARLDWQELIRLCIDPEKAQRYRDSLPAVEKDLCSMCGKFCAMKRSNEFRKPSDACAKPAASR